MDQAQIVQIFQDAGALLQGHFLLSSGLHSQQYLQCARVLENPQIAQGLCQALAKKIKQPQISAVIGPALGGIIVAYELARAIGVRALFSEREAGTDKMCLRRGFEISAREKILVCEDVITTGGSAQEVVELIRSRGAELIGVCCLVDRSSGKIDFGVALESLIKIDVPAFSAEDCPLCRKNIPVVKPGSRK